MQGYLGTEVYRLGTKRLCVLLATAAMFAATVSCGHNHRDTSSGVGAGLRPALESPGRAGLRPAPTTGNEQSLDSILRDIDAYPAPKGVSAETWETLKAELERLLVARAGGSKTISIAPTWSGNAVSDLSALSNAAGTQATLSWTEVLPGDYNNDGEVYITDLIPVALYYGQSADSGADDAHKLVNGDADPTINEGDLAAVATNYAAHLQGYQVWRGHWNGSSTDWETTPRPNPNPANLDWSADRPSPPPPVSTRPAYTFVDDISALTDKANVRYKVTAFGDGAAGAESNEAFMQQPPVGLADTPWPKFRGNARNTGRSPYVGAQTNNIKWRFIAGGEIQYASPTIGLDGTVYISCGDGYFYALNPSDGTMKWRVQTGGSMSSGAVGADGTIYVGGNDDYVHALNPLDGSVKWKRMLAANGADSSPAIGTDGTIYAGCGVSLGSNDTFFALNPGDGSVKWKRALGQGVSSSPAIGADGTIYASGDGVYALNPGDGSTKWTYVTGSWLTDVALGADGSIYAGSGDNNVYALNPDGSVKWTYNAGRRVGTSPAVGADGTVYVGSNDSKVYALNPSDGSVVWTFPTAFWAEGSPAIDADGTIYTSAFNFYAIAHDGTEKWRLSGISDAVSSPAIGADGTVYFGSSAAVYAIGP